MTVDSQPGDPPLRADDAHPRFRNYLSIPWLCRRVLHADAPAAFHATSHTGHRNLKWNGASPAQTQGYFTRLWTRIRARLHRDGLRIFGIRVAEPHHDGTPHWHLLLFMQPQNREKVREILRDFAHQQDSEELRNEKARKARFHAEAIDAQKGSATGYVAKYIAKNIDGYALDNETDHETDTPLKESACAVSAWAARWHIRQFQFVGGAPVTVYRELRKMADSATAKGLSVEFADVHDAADNGDWAGYVNAQAARLSAVTICRYAPCMKQRVNLTSTANRRFVFAACMTR